MNDPKVMLVSPPQIATSIHGMYAFSPLSLFSLGAMLLKLGCMVSIVDLNRERFSSTEFGQLIRKFSPDIIGITAMVPNPSLLTVLEIIRSYTPNTLTVMGGAFATASSKMILKHMNGLLDVVVRGEGEQPLGTLVNYWRKSNTLYKLKNELGSGRPGFAFMIGGLIRDTGINIEHDLSIYIHAYHMFPDNIKYYDRILLTGSRGCPYSCKFCASKSIYGKKIKYVPTNRLVNEIKTMYHSCGKRKFYFIDDLFGFNKEWLSSFLDGLETADLKDLEFWFGSRADLLDKSTLERATKLGLRGISVGLETIRPETQKSINKNLNIDSYKKTIRTARKLGLMTETGVIIGLPGETPSHVRQTIDFLDNINPDIVHLATLQILPGTEYYRRMSQYGIRMAHPFRNSKELLEPQSYQVAGRYFKVENFSSDDIAELKEYAFDRLDFRVAEYRNTFFRKIDSQLSSERY